MRLGLAVWIAAAALAAPALVAAPAFGQGLEVVEGRVGMLDAEREHIIQIGEHVYGLPPDTPGAADVGVGESVRATLEARPDGYQVLKLESLVRGD
jgi:hypothetical protein